LPNPKPHRHRYANRVTIRQAVVDRHPKPNGVHDDDSQRAPYADRNHHQPSNNEPNKNTCSINDAEPDANPIRYRRTDSLAH